MPHRELAESLHDDPMTATERLQLSGVLVATVALGAATWHFAGLATLALVGAAVIVCVVAPLACVYEPLMAYALAGVFKSADHGQNWTVLSTVHPTKGLVRLLLDHSNPSVIYAEAELDGLYKSTNRGQSWKRIDDGLPDLSTRALAIDPRDSMTLYVGTFKRGIFKSTNGGESWQPTGLSEQAEAIAFSKP